MSLKVEHDPQQRRFHAAVDGQELELDYATVDQNTVDFQRTFVPEELRGKGLAGELVTYALDWARHRDLEVVATCPYVQKFIQAHPEYQAVVTRPD